MLSCGCDHLQNDTITISRHHANDHQVKLAICHALAQSTKLCVYEERVLELVLETKHLPQALAIHGTVHITSQVGSPGPRRLAHLPAEAVRAETPAFG